MIWEKNIHLVKFHSPFINRKETVELPRRFSLTYNIKFRCFWLPRSHNSGKYVLSPPLPNKCIAEYYRYVTLGSGAAQHYEPRKWNEYWYYSNYSRGKKQRDRQGSLLFSPLSLTKLLASFVIDTQFSAWFSTKFTELKQHTNEIEIE